MLYILPGGLFDVRLHHSICIYIYLTNHSMLLLCISYITPSRVMVHIGAQRLRVECIPTIS